MEGVKRFQKPQKPSTARFSDVYQFGAKVQRVSNDVKKQAKELLKQASYSDSQITNIIDKDEPLPTNQLKSVLTVMHQAELKGMDKPIPEILIKNYVKKERVRTSSIGRIKYQHLQERLAEQKVREQAEQLKINQAGKPKSGGSKINLKF